ncbi:MAG: EamA family transporter [Candidatus Sedimenticola sp. PURPLELP]
MSHALIKSMLEALNTIYLAAGLINATTPLFTVITAGIFLADEKTTRLKLLGVSLGFVGVIVMIGPKALNGLGTDVIAQLAVLGAALSYAFAGVYGRRFKSMKIDPITTAAGQVTASAMVLVPLAIFFEKPLSIGIPGTGTMAAMLSLAILSTSVAYILYFRLLATAGATNLLLVTFLIPVSAIILGSQVLGETLEPIHYLGMALISIGLSAIDGRLWKKRGDRNQDLRTDQVD